MDVGSEESVTALPAVRDRESFQAIITDQMVP
jgi:hypothetical protein